MKALEEIAPLWAKSLKDGMTADIGLDINAWERCIVGEAYAFKAKYTSECWDCVHFAEEISETTIQEEDGEIDSYDAGIIGDFVTHWHERHWT